MELWEIMVIASCDVILYVRLTDTINCSETDRWIVNRENDNRQTYIHTDRQTYRQTDQQTDIQTHRQIDSERL